MKKLKNTESAQLCSPPTFVKDPRLFKNILVKPHGRDAFWKADFSTNKVFFFFNYSWLLLSWSISVIVAKIDWFGLENSWPKKKFRRQNVHQTIRRNALNHYSVTLIFQLKINPFLPTGQFMAPKLIILTKCLIDVLFFKVLF